jgi:hypothetical protein
MISINIKYTRLGLIKLALLLFVGIGSSCSKQEVFQDDPYKGGKEALGVKFLEADADPSAGSPGDEVTFKVRGVMKFKEKLEFLVNETKADIINVTDTSITVKIPQNASTGGTTLLLEGQSFFGPKFTVQGKVSIDPGFKAVNGTNGVINDIVATSAGGYILVGGFTNFENLAPSTPINRIVAIANDGAYTSSLFRGGSDGPIQNISRLSSGKYMISGSFSSFNRTAGTNGVTRLNGDGSLDSMSVELINPRPNNPTLSFDTVPTFNGGVISSINAGNFFGGIAKSFVRADKTILLGSFDFYVKYFYPRSTKDSKIIDITKMAQIAQLKENGDLDSAYNFDPVKKQSYAGTNGPIYGAYMQSDGKIVAVGSFSTFNGTAAKNIVRINIDGSIDPTFSSGTGADGAIFTINYNETTNRIMLTGSFRNYNGKSSNGVLMLNSNGTVDESFKFGQLIGGAPNFAAQLNNGKVIISGDFNSYNGVVRQGFMILGLDGTLAPGCNNTGAFQGRITRMIQTTSTLGYPAVLLVGDFTKFDNRRVGNIVRVEIKP